MTTEKKDSKGISIAWVIILVLGSFFLGGFCSYIALNHDNVGYELKIDELSKELTNAQQTIELYQSKIPDSDALIFNSDDELQDYFIKQLIENSKSIGINIQGDSENGVYGEMIIKFGSE